MTVRKCKFKGLAEGEIVCKFCAHQGENCWFQFGADGFEQKCCENCGEYFEGRCVFIEDWAYKCTGIAVFRYENPANFCSAWEPKEEK